MPLTSRRRSVIASKRSVRVTFDTGFIPVSSWEKVLCSLISGALCAPDSQNNRPNQQRESHLACPLGPTGFSRRRCLYQTLLDRSLGDRSEIINRDDSYSRLSLATRLTTRPSRGEYRRVMMTTITEGVPCAPTFEFNMILSP